MARCSSPDSSISISSLLASCSLGSSKGSSTTPGVEYKDRLYGSASAALEAYIQDYEESLHSSTPSTRRIGTPPATAPASTKRKGGREHKVHPKSFSRRLYSARDPDLLSLTTDDLLGFPSDGSLPFSQVTEQQHWQSFTNLRGPSRHSAPTLASTPKTFFNARTNPHPFGLSCHSKDLRDLQKVFREQRRHILLESDREDHPAYHNNLDSPNLSGVFALSKSYPRWLTSQKSELGVSGISSIPDARYPLWLRDYGLLLDSDHQATQNLHKFSNVRESLKNISEASPLDCLRSQSHVPDGKDCNQRVNSVGGTSPSDLNMIRHLHSTLKNRVCDLPLPKSEAFDFSQKEFPRPPKNNRSPQTEDVLEAERSWEKVPYPLKSPVPVSSEDGNLKGLEMLCNPNLVDHSKVISFSGGNHHGPVEALKHMLFNLQAFQQNFPQGDPSERVKEFQKVYMKAETEIQQQELFPVNKSLQKALQHLARLKELAGDGAMDHDQEI